jgi:hypothetical protein
MMGFHPDRVDFRPIWIHRQGPAAAIAQGLVVGIAISVTYALLRYARR